MAYKTSRAVQEFRLDVSKECRVDDRPLWLAPYEAEIVYRLLKSGFVSYGELTDILWAEEDGFPDYERRLRVHLSHIREKAGDEFEVVPLWGLGYYLVKFFDFPIVRLEPDDPVQALAVRFFNKYGTPIGANTAKFLWFLVGVHIGSHEAIESRLWPERYSRGEDVSNRRRKLVNSVRNRLGSLVEITNVPGYGYVLDRLGSEDNPIHERD